MKEYFVYIVTNSTKTTLYIGVTNDLKQRIIEHYLNRGKSKSFAGRYRCYNLLYYETFENPAEAIDREKELKKWRREKKIDLIQSENPNWIFLNSELFDSWPINDEDFSSR